MYKGILWYIGHDGTLAMTSFREIKTDCTVTEGVMIILHGKNDNVFVIPVARVVTFEMKKLED